VGGEWSDKESRCLGSRMYLVGVCGVINMMCGMILSKVCVQSGDDQREGRVATQDASGTESVCGGEVRDWNEDYTGNTGTICMGTSASAARKDVRRHGKARQEIGAKGVASEASMSRCW
jgi:hypothetical protein